MTKANICIRREEEEEEEEEHAHLCALFSDPEK